MPLPVGLTWSSCGKKTCMALNFWTLAQRLRKAIGAGALLVVNERVDVAAALPADGVQLGEDAVPVTAARRILGPDMVIGRSVHSVEGQPGPSRMVQTFWWPAPCLPAGPTPGNRRRGQAWLAAWRQVHPYPSSALGALPQKTASKSWGPGHRAWPSLPASWPTPTLPRRHGGSSRPCWPPPRRVHSDSLVKS